MPYVFRGPFLRAGPEYHSRPRKEGLVVTHGAPRGPVRATLGSFVGRRQELTRLRSLLSETRLVTITGPGGAGKTRLAEELASSVARSFDGGVAVAYLAPATSAANALEITATATGVRAGGVSELQRQLADYCGERALLVVLDNCEHLADAAAELAASLLRSSEHVRVLATGRRPLHVPGEQIYPLGGLGTDAALELFIDRARRAVPDLSFDDEARTVAIHICSRLESMPLAVELAAAQLRTTGLSALALRVERDAAGLSTRSPLAPERQRTLRQAVAWSHDLMSEAQRIVWRRLSVFSGGFTLGAAEQVVAMPPLDTASVAGLLGDLVDQSMVVFDSATDRYRLLEVLNELAGERLAEAGEERTLTERHRRWLVELVSACDETWHGPEQARILDTLESEAANIRAALERCRRDDAGPDGLRLADSAFAYWIGRASLAEGARWYASFLGRSGDLALEARAHWRAAYLATFCFDFATAHQMLDQASRILDSAEDRRDRAYVRAVRAGLLLYEHPEQCAEARRLADELAADATAEPMARSWASLVSAIASLVLDDFARCRDTCLAAETAMRLAGDRWSLERILVFLAHAEWKGGHSEAAEAHLLECIRIDQAMGDLGHLAWAADTLGWVTLDLGKPERAARLLGLADAAWIRSGARLAAPFQRCHDDAMARLRQALGETKLASETAKGRDLDGVPAFAFILGTGSATQARIDRDAVLSARELEIAALVADGLTNRAIAEHLFLSPRTVEKHIEHVMNKIGVDSRAAIAAWHAKNATTP